MTNVPVCVTIVTCNSRRFIGPCLDAVLQQAGVPPEVVVVDNASTDGTRELLASFGSQIRVLYNERNLGFAAAQNQAIALSASEWVLTLNPDVLMLPGFISQLFEMGRADPSAGVVCGKLLRIAADFSVPAERRIDSAGMYFTPEMRHFDRGWGEADDGRFDRTEYVFGASAAAALYRREMIDDISVESEFFDPDFFAYREDADVAWRAQLLGWRCLYFPKAEAYHVRRVCPGSRRVAPPVLNMHSVKNRFLLRIKNVTGGLYGRHWIPATLRDLQVLGGCLICEQRSLPAFWRLALCFPRAFRKRRYIMSRRTVSDEALAEWFGNGSSAQRIPSHPRRVALE